MRRLGIITIGQSPRNDVVPELMEFVGQGTLVLQEGALDYVSSEEILNMYPKEGDYVLVSTLRNGSCVKIAEKHILGRLQDGINKLESKGAEIILFICTGTFPEVFESKVPLIYPQKIMHNIVPYLTKTKKVAVIIPEEDQVLQTVKRWQKLGLEAKVIAYSPYKKDEDITKIRELSNYKDIDIIIMDCMGYTADMKKKVKEITAKPVILGRSLTARVIGEML